MRYHEIPPPPALKDFIRYFWMLESTGDNSPGKFRVMVNGCPGLIMHNTNLIARTEFGEAALPRQFLYGQSTQYFDILLKGTYKLLGIYFEPLALKALFNISASSLTNGHIEFKELFKINENLLFDDKRDCLQQLKHVSDFLTHQIPSRYRYDHHAQHALDLIQKAKGKVSIEEVRKDLKISERHLERIFNDSVGVTPKFYSRIIRFQHSMQELKNIGLNSYSKIAYDSDFADQSHFIREFRMFSGLTPKTFTERAPQVAENLSLLH